MTTKMYMFKIFLIVVWASYLRLFAILIFQRKCLRRIRHLIEQSKASDYAFQEQCMLIQRALLLLQTYGSRDYWLIFFKFWRPVRFFYPKWFLEEVDGTSAQSGTFPHVRKE